MCKLLSISSPTNFQSSSNSSSSLHEKMQFVKFEWNICCWKSCFICFGKYFIGATNTNHTVIYFKWKIKWFSIWLCIWPTRGSPFLKFDQNIWVNCNRKRFPFISIHNWIWNGYICTYVMRNGTIRTVPITNCYKFSSILCLACIKLVLTSTQFDDCASLQK